MSGRQEEAGPSGSQQVPRPSGSTQSQVPPLHMRAKRPRRMTQLEEESLKVIRDAAAIMRAPLNPVEAYSCYMADKLQKIEEGQRALTEDLFASVLPRAMRGQLTEATHLCDLAHPSPPPPATFWSLVLLAELFLYIKKGHGFSFCFINHTHF